MVRTTVTQVSSVNLIRLTDCWLEVTPYCFSGSSNSLFIQKGTFHNYFSTLKNNAKINLIVILYASKIFMCSASVI